MLVSHHLCTVESFRLEYEGAASGTEDMVLEGWFLSHAAVLSMRLVFSDGAMHEVSDRTRNSDDVWGHHRHAFGERAANARFRLVRRTDGAAPDYASAELHVRMEGGEMLALALGRALRIRTHDGESVAVQALAETFVAFGADREFGLVQRQLGCGNAALLRDASAVDVFALSSAVENRFADLGRPGAIRIVADGDEWIAHVPAAQLVFRTGRATRSIGRESLLAEQTSMLSSLARTLVAELGEARKIFVHRAPSVAHGDRESLLGCDRLLGAIRTIGPARLLWVSTADDAHPPGTLLPLGEGAWRGWIAAAAPPDPPPAGSPLRSWTTLLDRARRGTAATAGGALHGG